MVSQTPYTSKVGQANRHLFLPVLSTGYPEKKEIIFLVEIEGSISGHSLRIGAAISLAQAGAGIPDMEGVGRWKDLICQPVTQAHSWQRAVQVHLYINTFVLSYKCMVKYMAYNRHISQGESNNEL